MRISVLFAMLLGACAGTDVDEGNGPVCSKALYDECDTEHDCDSNECRNFMGDGFQVCTTQCSASVPCPDHNGVPVTCNNMGVCKPAAPTECRVLH